MNRNIDDTGNYTLGGSDANRLMRGEWLDLYKEIKDEKPRDDLSKVLQVQIGIATENLNLDFLFKGLPKIDKKEIKLDGMKQYDMKDNIKWKDFVRQYKTVKPYIDEYENCKKAIKGLVPDDCYRASGEGVVVTRNKRNILTIKEENNGK